MNKLFFQNSKPFINNKMIFDFNTKPKLFILFYI